MIKVLVVDDSLFMRKIITKILEEDEEIVVVGSAKNGKEAVEMNLKLSPDVITLDVEMPIMNGLEALKEIMNTKPTKVIMLSSLTTEGAKETIEALENGAFDFLSKPDGKSVSLNIEKVSDELIEMVKEAKKANINLLKVNKPKITKETSNKFSFSSILKKKAKTELQGHKKPSKIVSIGISTGGPKALQTIIPKIPGDIDAGILIVQHMPPKFTKSLADRLNELSNIEVREAQDGDKIERGVAYIAPGSHHMVLSEDKETIKLNLDPPSQGHRPSVDVMYNSLIKNYDMKSLIAVIMTGMGKDGAEGIKKIRELGGITIGQSKETCVVYGMPRVADELGGVEYVADLEKIPEYILKHIK
ncbi:MAG: chemotaxis response regulator protein-glutamate methylesterase [Fusobacteriales bacterium]|nr:chemotaxis response regulator protein-glutamate methylesterase [Fusobacteriales bacterium]